MNLAYFRKSTHDQQTTIKNVEKQAKKLKLDIIGTSSLPKDAGTVVHICNPEWLSDLINIDKQLVGLLPCSVVITKQDSDVMVGVSSPSLLGGVSQNPAINKLAADVESTLKELVHEAAGVGPMKATSIKLYSTTTCPYCKMEASWLNEKKVEFDEVHVDLNQQEAEEMVKKTGQMGVPVTRVEYDGGEEEFIVGFDKNRLSQILNIKS